MLFKFLEWNKHGTWMVTFIKIESIWCFFRNSKRLEKLFWIFSRGILENGFWTTRHFVYWRPSPAVWSRKTRQSGDFGMYKLGEFVHYKYKITRRTAFYFRTNIRLSKRLNETSCGNSLNNFVCRAFSLIDFDCSRIRNLKNLLYAQAFVRCKSTIIFIIAWLFQRNITSLQIWKKIFCRNSINIFICRCKVSSTCRFYSMLKLGLGHFVILQTNIVFGIALQF